jgi:hypothetical protein
MRKMWVPREFAKIPEQWHFAPVLDTCWTAIGVTELITEGTLLEIRVIAQRP